MKILKIVIYCSAALFFGFNNAEAARIYFDPPPSTHKVGDSFTLGLVLDTEGTSINAVDINIRIPDLLRVKNVSKNGSVIQLWVKDPGLSGKILNLTGGIPSGINGSGTIAKVSFEAVAVGEANIAFVPGSSILLNDGQGTVLNLDTAGGPYFRIIPKPAGETVKPEQESKAEKDKDDKKPKKFEISIGQDPRVFNGKHFISFFTTDDVSGVDHYEVKEGGEIFKKAQSPYLLSDQDLRSVIRVRAYDSSGNYRETVYPNAFKRFWWKLISIF